jgi:hypothetical protein
VAEPLDPFKPILVALKNLDASLGWPIKARLYRSSDLFLERAMHDTDRMEGDSAWPHGFVIPFFAGRLIFFTRL